MGDVRYGGDSRLANQLGRSDPSGSWSAHADPNRRGKFRQRSCGVTRERCCIGL